MAGSSTPPVPGPAAPAARTPFGLLLAEGGGTFALVFAGTGAIVVDDVSGGALGHVGVSLVFGLVVFAVIQAIGGISGAHINPAVTLGFLAAGRLPAARALRYVGAQLLGALAASALLAACFAEHATLGATLPAAGRLLPAALFEVVCTALLMLVILRVSSGAREVGLLAGAAIGATVALAALFAGPISGASMNPARSLAPALLSGRFEHLWIYLALTTFGALLAVPLCRGLGGGACCGPDEACA